MIKIAFTPNDIFTNYLEEDVIYDPSIPEKNQVMSSIKLTYEINQPTILEFEVPRKSVYEKIVREQINSVNDYQEKYIPIFFKPISIFNNEKPFFKGLLVSLEEDIYGNIKATYSSPFFIMKYAITSVERIKNNFDKTNKMLIGDFYKAIIEESNIHYQNDNVGNQYLIKPWVGESIENDKDTFIEKKELDGYSNFVYVLDLIKDLILDKYGGYLSEHQGRYSFEDYSDIYYLSDKDLNRNDSQIIVLGENLLFFSKKISTENLYNGIVPIGKDNLYLSLYNTVMSNTMQKPFIDEDSTYNSDYYNFRNFKYIFKNFDGINNVESLKEEANKYLDALTYPYDINIQVEVFDQSIIDPSKEPIKCGQLVRIVSDLHGIDDYFLCNKVVMDLINPGNSRYSFGSSSPKITDDNNSFKYNYENSFFRKQISDINKKLNS